MLADLDEAASLPTAADLVPFQRSAALADVLPADGARHQKGAVHIFFARLVQQPDTGARVPAPVFRVSLHPLRRGQQLSQQAGLAAVAGTVAATGVARQTPNPALAGADPGQGLHARLRGQ